jgi:hypothetical protein
MLQKLAPALSIEESGKGPSIEKRMPALEKGRGSHVERLGMLSGQIIETLASHRLDHQFAERPDERLTSIGREPCRSAIKIGAEGAHLIFQCREGADVMNAALFI